MASRTSLAASASHIEHGLANGRDRRGAEICIWYVVETDHGTIVWNAAARLPKRPDSSEGGEIVEGNHCGEIGFGIDELRR
jgi:hypothetical protein